MDDFETIPKIVQKCCRVIVGHKRPLLNNSFSSLSRNEGILTKIRRQRCTSGALRQVVSFFATNTELTKLIFQISHGRMQLYKHWQLWQKVLFGTQDVCLALIA